LGHTSLQNKEIQKRKLTQMKRELAKFAKFALIPLLIFVVVLIIPFISGLANTFTDWNGFKITKWVGWENYVEAFKDQRFWETLNFTFGYSIVVVVLVNVVGFLLALLVTVKLKSANVFRTMIFVPNLIGGVILGVIWQFIFNRALTNMAEQFNWEFFKSTMLSDPGSAFWALIIVTVWQSSGYMMIIYITGLMSIETDVLEAARIDGASPFRTLISIKMPLMAQAFTISLFLTLRSAFMAYDVNLSLTGGGPYRSTELISMHVYTEAFDFGHFATGQAKAVIMFIVIALAALTQVFISKRMEVQR
jgi:raffinose/stachyose/melibiose transport system permease protein